MFTVTVEEVPAYKYQIDFGYELVAQSFKSWFQTEVTSSEFIRYYDNVKRKMTGKRQYKTELVPLWRGSSETDPCKVTINRGHLEWLAYWIFKGPGSSMALSFNPRDYVTKEKPFLKYPNDDPRSLKLQDKWRKIFSGHPRGQFYIDAQIDGFHTLGAYAHTAVNMGTGLGKTEIILALVDHLVGDCVDPENPSCKGNVAIFVPGTAIKDGILSRAKQWGTHVDYKNWDPSNRVNIINPVGFLNSNSRNDPKVIEWLSNVEAVITDEAHKLSSDSASDFFTFFLPNVKRSMALSGSLDKVSGRYLHPTKIPVKAMSTSAGWVTGLSGPCRFDRKVAVSTNLTVISGAVTEKVKYDALKMIEEDTAREVSWMHKLELLIASPRLPDLVRWVYDNHLVKPETPKPRLYIPFATRDSGSELEEGLLKQGFRVCYWTAGTVRVNGEKFGSDLADVVKATDDDLYEILLTSKVSYEGVDLKGLTAVMPLLGSNWSMIAQPIGRAARGNSLEIFMLLDSNNGYVYNSTTKRRDKVMEEYNIASYRTLNWEA